MSDQIQHLEMVQRVIDRMAGSSFLLRGWSVTLVSALFALAAKDAVPTYVLVAFFPCVLFWILDGYYLAQERLFRRLFDAVHDEHSSVPPFSMDTSRFTTNQDMMRSIFSLTIGLFHGMILGTILLVMFVLQCPTCRN